MKFFDYERIYLLARGNSDLIVKLFNRMLTEPDAHQLLVGSSFILNESTIVNNPYKLSNRQLAEYLGILSLRNYAEYKFTNDPSLDMQYVPVWIPRSVIDTNPLIAINKSKIIFKEEIKYG